MRTHLFLASLCLFNGVHAIAKPITQNLATMLAKKEFTAFESKYDRKYGSESERHEKFQVFLENLEEAVELNAALREQGKDEVHGITQFSDMTKKEFQFYLNKKMAEQPDVKWPVAEPKKKGSVPTSFDWRDSGAVTPVKNQAQCGSCWAFSATETVESQYIIGGNNMTVLSVETTVSCDTSDNGCGGGWYYTAWMDYMSANGGITTQDVYPYAESTKVGNPPACDTSLESQVVKGTAPSSYAWATTPCTTIKCASQDEATLQANLVEYGPISIACDASAWSSYTGGVLTSSSCSSSSFKLDHAIQLVGYNTDASTPYWIVRNSWGSTWGEDGYIYLEMNQNTCGVADKPAMVYL
jgi:C1A family cysteine protease